jgi:hypothetical protein
LKGFSLRICQRPPFQVRDIENGLTFLARFQGNQATKMRKTLLLYLTFGQRPHAYIKPNVHNGEEAHIAQDLELVCV